MNQTVRVVLAGLAAGIILITLTMTLVAKTKEPRHKVLSKNGKFEIREYEAVVAAEVVSRGDRSAAANRSFRILFNYISGENRSQSKIPMTSPVAMNENEKIPMTAPVTEQESCEGWHVRFFLPPTYSLETAPQPTNPAIRMLQLPSERFVSVRFSGSSSESNLSEHLKQLEDYIHEKELKITGDPVFAFYNAPFVPPPFRRNEILWKLSD
jgi:effector-binding domain-containing protein